MLHKGTGQGLQQISLSNFSPLSIYPLIWIILKRRKSNQRDTDFYLKEQPKYKQLKVPTVEEDPGKKGPPGTTGGNAYWYKRP